LKKVAFILIFVIANMIGAVTYAQKLLDFDPNKDNPIVVKPHNIYRLLLADLQLGQYYSNNKAFNNWLKANNYSIDNTSSNTVGFGLKYQQKHNVIGAKWHYLLNETPLKQQNVLLSYGYNFHYLKEFWIRPNLNIGLSNTKIKLGETPPKPIIGYNLAHDFSVLKNRQILIGPSIELAKAFRSNETLWAGYQLAVEAGMQYNVTLSGWTYGYNTIFEPQQKVAGLSNPAQYQYFMMLKLGWWWAP
jgi:hypothetical protein